MQIDLTIIIPCYNVEKFIEKNLDSFVNSKVREDIEVLVDFIEDDRLYETYHTSYVDKVIKAVNRLIIRLGKLEKENEQLEKANDKLEEQIGELLDMLNGVK